ncbi:hypothetical protein TRIUR3_27665 [Triticum urartu]|uniref:Uncharacterized protein n=1 Tax=Triticum urartu TaxID=4572 RepID=M7Z1N9_TRIUA|nr:hypothetical protein TRIUR3_27665 [Triticum urartu]
MEDVQLLVLLGLFSKRPSYRNSASVPVENNKLSRPTSFLQFRHAFIHKKAGSVGKFSTLCNSRCKGPRFLVVTLQPHRPFCRQELCPDELTLYYPNLLKVISSDSLEKRLRAIQNNAKDGAACHVLGHTHFCWDYAVDNIRYVQAPLAYPRERKRRINGGQGWLPFFVYCDGFNPETRIEGSLRTLSLRHGSSNFLFIRLQLGRLGTRGGGRPHAGAGSSNFLFIRLLFDKMQDIFVWKGFLTSGQVILLQGLKVCLEGVD